MSDAWFFIIGLPIGGLAVGLYYHSGPLAELRAKLDEARQSH